MAYLSFLEKISGKNCIDYNFAIFIVQNMINTFDNIIRRALRDSLSEVVGSKPVITVPRFMYHKAPPYLRKVIGREGLKAQVGGSYSCHWEGEGKKLVPGVFLYNKDVGEYDTTYDDDIYEVDTQMLDMSKFDKDPDGYMYEAYGSVIFTDDIPPVCLRLVKRGK